MIKTIIFDFGDVFIQLDKKAPMIELGKLGLNHFSEEMLQLNIQYKRG